MEHFLQWSSDGVADLGLFERNEAKLNAFGASGIIICVKPNYRVTQMHKAEELNRREVVSRVEF